MIKAIMILAISLIMISFSLVYFKKEQVLIQPCDKLHIDNGYIITESGDTTFIVNEKIISNFKTKFKYYR